MKSKQVSFRELLLSFASKYRLQNVFQDFLGMCLCAFCINPLTGKSYYEDEYLSYIQKYDAAHQKLFPDLLAQLVIEMENSVSNGVSKDVLGEVYQELFYQARSGQFFTPEHITDMMASISGHSTDETLSIIDPCCGSGRMLLSSTKTIGKHHRFFGIDIDHTCVQMTAVNLFLNGIFHAEVMCANALQFDDFHISYRISFLPFGIFRITDKEQSLLYHMRQHQKENHTQKTPQQTGMQLTIF